MMFQLTTHGNNTTHFL